MQWYTSRFKKEIELSPPSYLIERISDLEYANKISIKSPSEAKKVLANIIHNLETHHDDDYVIMLTPAFQKMLDSPTSSKKIISRVIGMMVVARDEAELKEAKKWKKT